MSIAIITATILPKNSLAAILSFLLGSTFFLPLTSQFCIVLIFSPFFFDIFCLNCLVS